MDPPPAIPNPVHAIDSGKFVPDLAREFIFLGIHQGDVAEESCHGIFVVEIPGCLPAVETDDDGGDDSAREYFSPQSHSGKGPERSARIEQIGHGSTVESPFWQRELDVVAIDVEYNIVENNV